MVDDADAVVERDVHCGGSPAAAHQRPRATSTLAGAGDTRGGDAIVASTPNAKATDAAPVEEVVTGGSGVAVDALDERGSLVSGGYIVVVIALLITQKDGGGTLVGGVVR